ncbi:uncharacterized protein TNCV_250191 [Trichonephila clavipes]|nr:uncharacterized protein TNCV_250191 [Trichonephila clavipes]
MALSSEQKGRPNRILITDKGNNPEHIVQEQILPPLYLLKLCVAQLTFKIFKETNNTTLSPTPSVKTILSIENSKKKRKRVQSKTGEVLTTENVLERLAAEESDRKNKFHKVNTKKNVKDTKSFKGTRTCSKE